MQEFAYTGLSSILTNIYPKPYSILFYLVIPLIVRREILLIFFGDYCTKRYGFVVKERKHYVEKSQ
jgi:hypothetical protein